MTISDARLDELEKVAQEATPGPWYFQPWSSYALPSGDYAESILMANSMPDGEIARGIPNAEGEFIAAFNPAVVLELIGGLRQVRAELGDVFKTDIPSLKAERDAAVAVLDRVGELAELDRRCPCCTGYENILKVIGGSKDGERGA